MSKSGNTGKKNNVMFSSQDAGAKDKKFEGYSNLKGTHDQQQKRAHKCAQNEMTKDLEEEYILNLQKQTVLMEHEIKLLKDREVDQKNKASGYETLLRDGIPLNEHFLALKNKFNNEQDLLKKQDEIMRDEIRKEEIQNKQKNHKIEILKAEYEQIKKQYNDYKDSTLKQMKDLETKLFHESHTKDVLLIEKQQVIEKINVVKGENQNQGRKIAKEKFHNNKAEIQKDRKLKLDELQLQINKISEEVEVEQTFLEEEKERNSDTQLLSRQKETTGNLKQDHNKIQTDITVARNRIKDLETRREILNSAIQDLLKDKRKIDKYNMELQDRISGRNVTDEMQKKKYKNEERKMRIKYEKNIVNLKQQALILDSKIGFEESQSKDVLEIKLKLDQELLDLREDLQKLLEKQQINRDDTIKQRVKNSQLDSQTKMLEIEEELLQTQNKNLIAENEELENENSDLKKKIALTIQRIDINNLLREIDIEELQLLAKNNKHMNIIFENMMTKWNYITGINSSIQ